MMKNQQVKDRFSSCRHLYDSNKITLSGIRLDSDEVDSLVEWFTINEGEFYRLTARSIEQMLTLSNKLILLMKK